MFKFKGMFVIQINRVGNAIFAPNLVCYGKTPIKETNWWSTKFAKKEPQLRKQKQI
jgi:hypothetical protein